MEITIVDGDGKEWRVLSIQGDRIIDLLIKAKSKGATLTRGSHVKVNNNAVTEEMHVRWKTIWERIDVRGAQVEFKKED